MSGVPVRAGDDELDIAGRVVDLVTRLAGPAAQAEVTVTRAESALTRFANSAIHQNVVASAVDVRLRVHLAGRTAAGSGNVVTADGLRALVERVLTAARFTPPDPAWPGLTPATPVAPAPEWDPATAHAGPDQRAALVRAFVDAAAGLVTAGYCRTGHRFTAFANSAGHSTQGQAAEAAMDGIARAGGADGTARLRRGEGPGGGRPGRAASRALPGGVGAGSRRGPATESGLVRLQRPKVRRTSVLRRPRHGPVRSRGDPGRRSVGGLGAAVRPGGHADRGTDPGGRGHHQGRHPRPAQRRRAGGRLDRARLGRRCHLRPDPPATCASLPPARPAPPTRRVFPGRRPVARQRTT